MRPNLWEDQFDLVIDDPDLFLYHERSTQTRRRLALRKRRHAH